MGLLSNSAAELSLSSANTFLGTFDQGVMTLVDLLTELNSSTIISVKGLLKCTVNRFYAARAQPRKHTREIDEDFGHLLFAQQVSFGHLKTVLKSTHCSVTQQ